MASQNARRDAYKSMSDAALALAADPLRKPSSDEAAASDLHLLRAEVEMFRAEFKRTVGAGHGFGTRLTHSLFVVLVIAGVLAAFLFLSVVQLVPVFLGVVVILLAALLAK